MSTRPPNEQESRRWITYRTRFEAKTKPMVQALVLLGKMADAAQNEIQAITGTNPHIVTQEAAATINEVGRRAQILDNQITGVLMQKYGVQFDDAGNMNIVGQTADENDIYPTDELSLGFAPIIIIAGIAAVTLLIAGDQAEDRLEQKAKIEALKLQQRMLEADRQMMTKPEPQRAQWERWKKTASEHASTVAKSIPGSQGWLSKFIGSKGTSIIIAGIVGIAAVYFLVPKFRRN
jgi:type II secretory pathway pseudopilin PulG